MCDLISFVGVVRHKIAGIMFFLMSILIKSIFLFLSLFLVLPCVFALGGGVSSSCVSSDGTSCSIEPLMCELNSSEGLIIKDLIYNELLSFNSSLSNYSFYNISINYCYETENVSYYSAVAYFKEEASSPQGIQFYISVSSNEGGVLTLEKESLVPYEYYDFSLFFSEEEDLILGYELKRRIIDNNDSIVWVIIYPKESDCSSLKNLYEQSSYEKYYYESFGFCSMYLKLSPKSVMAFDLSSIGGIDFFGNSLYFYYTGEANATVNLDSIISSLSDCNICAYSNPSCVTDETKNCWAYYVDLERYYASASKYEGMDSDYKYINVYVYGFVYGRGNVSVSAYGYSESDVSSFANEFMNKYFGAVINIKYGEPSNYLTRSSDSSIKSEGSSNYLTGSSEFNNFRMPSSDVLSLLNKSTYLSEVYYYGSFANYSLSFSFGSKYLSISKYSEKPFIYDYFSATNESVIANVVLESLDDERAKSLLSDKVGGYGVNVSLSSWNVSYSIISDTPIYELLDSVPLRSDVLSQSTASYTISRGGVPGLFTSSQEADYRSLLEPDKSLITIVLGVLLILLGISIIGFVFPNLIK